MFHRNPSHLTVVSSEVEVDSLWSGPVSSAVAGSECDPNNSAAIPSSEPSFLIVAFPTHRLLLLTLGHPALPWQAQDVGVTAEDWTMLDSSEHVCRTLHLPVDKLKNNHQVGGQGSSDWGLWFGVEYVTVWQRCIVLGYPGDMQDWY